MEWVKTTAKTLPEAIDLALDNLGVDESEAEIVVVEEPRQGLFGRMRGTARVEARVKPKAIRPKTERGRGRKRSEGGKKNDRSRNRSKNRSGDGGDRNRGGRSSGGGRGSGKGRSEGGQDTGAKDTGAKDTGARDSRVRDDAKASSGAATGSPKGGNGSGGQGGRSKSGGRDNAGRRSKAQRNNKDHDTKPKEESPVEDVAEHLENFLTGLTEAFGFDSDVSIDNTEQDVLIGQIEGQHGLLVGPKGRTLDAVQELARISCQRTVPSSIRIKVDVGGYRKQRTEALAAFAAKAADGAVEQGVEVALEPMSPADRKAVHDALSEDDRVETRSVGSEPRRKVLVIPVVDEADDTDDDDEHSEDEVEQTSAASSNGVGDAEDGAETEEHADVSGDSSEEE